jgi:hypothetical protein
MALQHNYQTQNNLGQDVTLDQSYIKVTEVRATKLSADAYVDFSVEGVGEGAVLQQLFRFVPSLDSTHNFIAQAYEHLKTLPEFEDAEDV